MKLPRRARKQVTVWQRDHPPKCPDGWSTGPPDFIGVGHQKAGTSWWYALLAEHPEVSDAVRPKELHFAMKLREQPEMAEVYYRHFPRRPGTIAGEFTPSYILPPGPTVLHAAAPDAKIILMLRDPVDRLESAITMDANRRGVFTLEIIAGQERRNRYAELLENLYRWYPPEQVLVLQYERCVADTPSQLARTYEFLGIDPTHLPQSKDEVVNRTTVRKRKLSDAERADLVERLWPDIDRLRTLVPDLDLDLWRTSMALAPERS